MTKAFLAVEGGAAAASNRIHEMVSKLTQQIINVFKKNLSAGSTLHIEDVQDQVEITLMCAGEHKVARAYVLYRETHRRARAKARKRNLEKNEKNNRTLSLRTQLSDGSLVPIDLNRMQTIVTEACRNLIHTDSEKIIKETIRNLFDEVPVKEINKALIMTARTLIESEPSYTYVAARLLLDTLREEALSFLGIANNATFDEMTQFYSRYFAAYIHKGIELNILNPKLADFDLITLGTALDAQRDAQFTYLSLQTLFDRYFIHSDNIRYELPQAFFMRVAMGLALEEEDKNERAIEFYQLLSSFDFMSSTPTLFNAGTVRPQLSSCFLTTVPDNLHGIYNAIRDNAMLSKFAGGLGNDWTPVRAMGSHIEGTNGKSLGVVPFLNVADATAIAVNQGGKRKGAVCAYLETWHLDIEEFLELRKNTGDDRRRTHDMNTANWIPDLFMRRVLEEKMWTLFSPDEVTQLHDSYGDTFEKHYLAYEALAEKGQIKNTKQIPAVKLWRKMLSLLFETGHPWITFKDPCNIRSPQQHCGMVHSSNLCTEITLNTSEHEIAVCNLGSINLPQHITDKQLDEKKLKQTIRTAVRMLDNVININYYSVSQARRSNLKHRPIGMGLMGFQDALYKLSIDYCSEAAVKFSDYSMEMISYHAIEASIDLAEERGRYESFDGSLWSQGILPIDSVQTLKNLRGDYFKQNMDQHLNWEHLRTRVQKTGIRNSNVMAIAPTATISNICGVSQSIEPTYQNLFVKSNLSGEFTVVNPYLVADLKAIDLWDEVMVNDLKYYDGSVHKIDRIPERLKRHYATAFEIDPKWLVECASRRQKWIDQAQSLNLYIALPSGKKLDRLYKMAWLLGLKTSYYLRTLGASDTEKSTVHNSTLNAVTHLSQPELCAIDNPDCDACQ